MKPITLAVWGALLFGSSHALAYPIQGFGATSCAEFAKIYKMDPGFEKQFYYWAQGYMSGMNVVIKEGNGRARELGKGNEIADHQRTIRNFCDQNPLKDYMDAVLELYGKLPMLP